VGEYTALQIRPKLALDESRHGGTLLACARKERLEMLADDLVEQCAFGLVPLILDGVAPSRDRVRALRPSKVGADSMQIARDGSFRYAETGQPVEHAAGRSAGNRRSLGFALRP
jgi:hypothetical protein